MKKYILFDHDGVLVDTEFWYYKAAERALADIGLALDKQQYLRDMTQGLGSWVQAKAAGLDEQALSTRRAARDAYYQEYLRTEAIEIEGVVEALVVEDTGRGLSSAVAAGIDCVIVYNDFTKTQHFSQASYRIDTLIGLKDIILTES